MLHSMRLPSLPIGFCLRPVPLPLDLPKKSLVLPPCLYPCLLLAEIDGVLVLGAEVEKIGVLVRSGLAALVLRTETLAKVAS